MLVGSVIASLIMLAYDTGYFVFLRDRLDNLSFINLMIIGLTNMVVLGQDMLLFFHLTEDGLTLAGEGIDPDVWPLQIVPQAWSISLELMFYALAPFLVRLRTSYLTGLILLLAGLRVALFAHGLYKDPWTNRFFPNELAIFMAGMLSYRLSPIFNKRALLNRSAIPGILFFSFSFMYGAELVSMAQIAHAEYFLSFVYLVCLFIVLGPIFRASKNSEWDARIGEMSYAIYLVHWQVMVVAQSLLFRTDGRSETLITITTVIGTLVLASILVKYCERPLDHYRARRRRAHLAPRTDMPAPIS